MFLENEGEEDEKQEAKELGEEIVLEQTNYGQRKYSKNSWLKIEFILSGNILFIFRRSNFYDQLLLAFNKILNGSEGKQSDQLGGYQRAA